MTATAEIVNDDVCHQKDNPDQITLLRAKSEARKFLRYENGVLVRKGVLNPKLARFSAKVFTAANLDDLLKRFRAVSKFPNAIFVHGKVAGGVDPLDLARDSVTLVECPHKFILFDLDGFEGPEDPVGAAMQARATLPAEFQAARCIWSATGSHAAVEGRANLRLIFWLSSPITTGEARAWVDLRDIKTDTIVYSPWQIVLLAPPKIFGRAEFVKERWGLIEGEAEVTVPAVELADATKTRAARLTIAVDGAEQDTSFMVRDFVRFIGNAYPTPDTIKNRRMGLFGLAQCAGDRFISEPVTLAIIQAWVTPSDDAAADLVVCLTEAGIGEPDAREIASDVVASGLTVADRWTEGDVLADDFVGSYVAQGYAGRKEPLGSKFSAPDEGDSFAPVEDEGGGSPFEGRETAIKDKQAEYPGGITPGLALALVVKDEARAKAAVEDCGAADGELSPREAFDHWRETRDMNALIAAVGGTDETTRRAIEYACCRFDGVDIIDGPDVCGDLAFIENLVAKSQATGKPKKKSAFESIDIRTAADLTFTESAPYLIDGLLDQSAMSVLYGPSNSGKSFVALDLAFAVASGARWNGRRTAKGLAVYVAAEGGKGILKRLAALRLRSPIEFELAAFELIRAPLDFRSNADHARAVARLIARKEAEQRSKAQIVIIDTLSRALAGGEENGSVDMGAFVQNCDILRDATSAHLLVVHHTGKDAAKGARGHSLLRAATDTELEIFAEADDRRLTVTKQRDHDGGQVMPFRLTGCVLREAIGDPEADEYQPNISSAHVAWYSGASAAPAKAPPLTEVERTYLAALEGLSKPPGGSVPHSRVMTTVNRARIKQGKTAMITGNANRLRKSIAAKGYISADAADDVTVLIGSDEAAGCFGAVDDDREG